MTSAGVGKSTHRNARQAGREAARQALERLSDAAPDLALVFATTGYDQVQLLGAIRSEIGDVPLAGCSAEGTITGAGTDEGSHAVALMLIGSDTLRFSTISASGLGASSERCGAELAQQVCRVADARSRALLLFPDGLTSNCTRMLAALQQGIPPLRVAGGTASDMMRFEKTYQYHDGQVLSDAVSAVLISGDATVDIAVSHGCDIVGLQRIITRSRGRLVEEIDGLPAWHVFREYLEGHPGTLRDANDIAQLAVAERVADAGGYIVRVPVAHDTTSGGLFFGAEMRTGTPIWLTRRVAHRAVENAVSSVQRMQYQHAGARPSWVLQLDCAGRGRQLFGERCTKLGLRPLQEVLGYDVPWVGCYTFGEIAPRGDRARYHNYTVVVCAVYG